MTEEKRQETHHPRTYEKQVREDLLRFAIKVDKISDSVHELEKDLLTKNMLLDKTMYGHTKNLELIHIKFESLSKNVKTLEESVNSLKEKIPEMFESHSEDCDDKIETLTEELTNLKAWQNKVLGGTALFLTIILPLFLKFFPVYSEKQIKNKESAVIQPRRK